MRGLRIGADVGGTFTDVLALDADGRVRFTKVLSTPPDYDRAVIDAVRGLAAGGSDAVRGGRSRHDGRDERGARAPRRANGARDDRGLPRRARAAADAHAAPLRLLLDEAAVARPEAPAVRDRRAGHRRRRGAEAARRGRGPGARAPRCGTRSPRRSPSACSTPTCTRPTSGGSARSSARSWPAVPVSLSSEILREQQEYERTATTVVNAYVRPLMERYLGQHPLGAR